MKHLYVVTEPIPGLARDAPTLRDPDRRTYFKEEVGGLVIGGYEPNPRAWTTGDVADDFAFRLFDDDFDHFEPHMINAIARVPALDEVGVRRMIHAPESFTVGRQFHSRPRAGARQFLCRRRLQRLRHRQRAAAQVGRSRIGSPTARRRWICGASTSGALRACTRTATG